MKIHAMTIRAFWAMAWGATTLVAVPHAIAQNGPTGEASKAGAAHVMVPIDADQIDELRFSSKEFSGAVRQIRRERRERLDSIDAVLKKIGKRDAVAIFEWVRANVSHEPYEGALRSPEVVLTTGSANAVDAARLMYALLDEADLKPVYAWGELKEDDARVLLLKFGELVQFEQGGELKEQALVFSPELLRATRDHMWVEVPMRGKETRALDVFVSPDGLNTPAKRVGSGSKVPSRHDATFEMKVMVTFDDGREEAFVPVSGSVDEFAHRTLTISLERDAKFAHTTRPVLTRGDEVLTGNYFPHEQIREMTLRFELKTGNYQQLWEQSLYEKGRSVDVFAAEQLHVGVTLLPGWTSRELVASQGVRGFDAALTKLNALVKEQQRLAKKGEVTPLSEAEYNEQTRALMDDVAQAFPYLFARYLDRMTHKIGHLMGVSPVIARPRLVMTAMVREGSQLFIDADIQGDSLNGMSASGMPLAVTQGFITLYSRLESEARAAVLGALTSEETLSTGELLRRARKQKIEVVTISSADTSAGKKLKTDKLLTRKLARRVKRVGKVVVAPTQDVSIQKHKRFGWWEIDPASGWFSGRLAHGLLNQPLDMKSAPDKVSQGVGVVTLGKLLGKQIAVWFDALDESQSFDALVCAAQRDLTRLGTQICKVGTKSVALPSLQSCLFKDASKGEDGGGDSGDAGMGDPLGGIGLESVDCASLTRPARCGVVLASAFLTGELRVLRGNSLGEFSADADALMCK